MSKKGKAVIEEEIGLLGVSEGGWITMLSKASIFDSDSMYDIRSWNADRSDFSHGVRFTDDELVRLTLILEAYIAMRPKLLDEYNKYRNMNQDSSNQ